MAKYKELLEKRVVAQLLTHNSNSERKEEFAYLGNTIREFRERASMSLKDLSDKSGIPLSLLSKYENAEMLPDYERLKCITNSLNLDFLKFVIVCLKKSDVFDKSF